MNNRLRFPEYTFGKRLISMFRVDFRRMFKSPLFYILIACALLIPVVMNVMMSMMDGSVSVDPQTGVETIIHGPENVWQSIGTLPTAQGAAMGGMDVMSMCNINMMFMLVAVFVCLFICADFRSGYAKNLFTVRARKGEYVVSKTLAGFICGAFMLAFYFIGAIIGGAVSGLSFEMLGFTAVNLVLCMIAKLFLMLVFVAIFVIVSVIAKQKSWLAICGSLGGGMLLFMMVSMITPLNSGLMNVFLCIAGGVLFSLCLGVFSRLVLNKTRLV